MAILAQAAQYICDIQYKLCWLAGAVILMVCHAVHACPWALAPTSTVLAATMHAINLFDVDNQLLDCHSTLDLGLQRKATVATLLLGSVLFLAWHRDLTPESQLTEPGA